jgi:transposase
MEESLRHALNVLATTAPDWLTAWVPAEWFERYRRPFAKYRLPEGKEKRDALAAQIVARQSGRRVCRVMFCH